MRLSRHGLTVAVPPGWDVRIYCRPAGPGETTHPVLHASTRRLPWVRGDYGSNAVDGLGGDDAFVALLELGADAGAGALFAARGTPRLAPRDFQPRALQRVLPGQAGAQRFFSVAGRAFSLYVVLGSFARRALVVPRVQELVDGIGVVR